MDSDHGERQIFVFHSRTLQNMSSAQNINTGTIVPIVVNPEAILVDSDPEEDLEEIQHEVVAKQKQIEEAAQDKLAAAHKRIEKKRQEWKAKEEEKWKVKEEEAQKQKEEEDKVIRDKALEEARKWQLKVSC